MAWIWRQIQLFVISENKTADYYHFEPNGVLQISQKHSKWQTYIWRQIQPFAERGEGGRGEEEEEEGQLAIFHRTQTWHLKCRSSTIVEIVEIWSSARNLVETSRVLGARTTWGLKCWVSGGIFIITKNILIFFSTIYKCAGCYGETTQFVDNKFKL